MEIDLTVSSDDDAPAPAPKRRDDDAPAPAPKRPRVAPPPPCDLPIYSMTTLRAASDACRGWRGERSAVRGDDEAASDDKAQTIRRLAASPEVFEDPEFPANVVSLKGKEAGAAPPPAPASGPPNCACGRPAVKAKVAKDTPNKGREYWHCANRRCGHFGWADAPGPAPPLSWARLDPSVPLVTDAGFSADDLAQGGLGDCWMLAAIAVVAERHDLIAKLFVDTVRNRAGAYGVRLFLDGRWTAVAVDERLPVTERPRRENTTANVRHVPLVGQNLSKDARLAYVRSRCAQTEAATGRPTPTLWASLLEKAYAKAHGSFSAISGGQIAEALLDLTGAPCFAMDMSARTFDSEKLWHNLMRWRRLRFPLGCATDPVPHLREVGLCGSHAYSITDVRVVRTAAGAERLLRIRNPHGVGEWNGDWSDKSDKWQALIDADPSMVRRTGDDDGTFWMDYTHFLMGFSRVDVCVAPPQFHARSFRNFFPAKKAAWRVAATCYRLRGSGDVFVMALQPTKRGAWCRTDRKKSYRPGDLQVVAYDADSGNVVGAALRGADVYDKGALALRLEEGRELVVFVFALGVNPAAAETTKTPPFHVRVVAIDAPASVDEVAFDAGEHGAVAVAALHGALDFRGPRRHDDLLFAAAAPPVKRLVKRDAGASCEVAQGEGVVCVTLTNYSDTARTVAIVAYCKSAAGRGVDGEVENHKDQADAYYERRKALEPPPDPRAPKGWTPRWPAKWKALVATADLPPRSRRLALAVVRSGTQYELGEIACEFADALPPPKRTGVQTSMDSFLGRPDRARLRKERDADGLFAAVALPDDFSEPPAPAPSKPPRDREAEELEEALRRSRGGVDPPDDLEEALRRSRGEVKPAADDLEEALRRSRDDKAPADDDLEAALRLSRAAPRPRDPDAELREALRRSRGETRRPADASEVIEIVDSDDDEELRKALALSVAAPAAAPEPAGVTAPAPAPAPADPTPPAAEAPGPTAEELRAARLARFG